MQQENEVPTQNTMEMLLCSCGPTKLNVSTIYFVLHYQQITEKVEVIKKATGRTSAILCRRYSNCLDVANLYSRSIKPSTKTCVF